MILLEEFDDLTRAVDCKGDDGLMSLTFKDQAAFDYALKTWSYINEKEESKFLVIANHEGCGPDDQRQPYLFVQNRSMPFVVSNTADLVYRISKRMYLHLRHISRLNLHHGPTLPAPTTWTLGRLFRSHVQTSSNLEVFGAISPELSQVLSATLRVASTTSSTVPRQLLPTLRVAPTTSSMVPSKLLPTSVIS